MKKDTPHSFWDSIAVYSVLLQVMLVIVQIVMIDVFKIDEARATTYRVLLAAFPIIISFVITFHRSSLLWIGTYFFIISIFLIHSLVFPKNVDYIMTEGIRFTLPMVIPCALILIAINNIVVIEKAMYYVSWVCFILVVYYTVCFFRGVFYFEKYDMAFSYGCLLPAMTLYHNKKWYSVIASFAILIAIVSIGSRGAAIVFAIYVLLDTLFFHRKLIIPGIIFVLVLFSLFPLFMSLLNDIGITSRTLTMIAQSDILSHDSGRGDIYAAAGKVINDHPLFGVGLFGDRVYIGGYVHNILLEILMDFGLLAGGVIILFFLLQCIGVFFNSSTEDKEVFIRYFCAGFVPLMVSGSYLKYTAFGIFIGILVILSKSAKKSELIRR